MYFVVYGLDSKDSWHKMGIADGKLCVMSIAVDGRDKTNSN